MSPAMASLEFLLLYGLVVSVVVAAARTVRRSFDGFSLAILVALPLLFLGPALAGDRTIVPVDHAVAYPPWREANTPAPRNPFLNDVATQFAPWAKSVRTSWKEGSPPLRNRWSPGEAPLAANGSAATFSPLTLLMFALPLAQAFTLAAAVKLVLALTGAWLWLTELEVSAGAALFGAVALAFSLTMTPWLLFPQTAVIALWPWTLFAIERLRRPEASRRALALLVVVFAVWPLSGHLESAASGAALITMWLLARWAVRDLPDAPRLFGRVTLAAGTALGLSAFALLPQIAAIAASNRLALVTRPFWGSHLSWTPHGPAWYGGLLMPFSPRFYGDAVTTPTKAGAIGFFPEMALGAIGLAAWAAALLVLRPGSPRRKTALALLAPLVVGFGVAVGQWPFAEVASAAPGLRWMLPLRFFSWVALAGTALAAFELDRLCRDLSPARTTRALPFFLAALSAAELFWHGRRFYLFGSSADLFPDRPILAFLRAQPGPFRVVGENDVLFPNSNVFAGLEDVRTHDPLERRDYVLFLHSSCGYDPTQYFKMIADPNCRGLDVLNAKYLVATPRRGTPGPKWKLVYSADDGTVFENTAVLPRILGNHVDVSSYRETTNTVAFRAHVAAGSGDALLSASFVQDTGWSATDGAGRPIPTGRTDGGLFLTLTLPPGDHDIRLTYRPPGWRSGLAITLATLGLIAVFATRRLRPSTTPSALPSV
jgi:hypothetical protein